MYETSSFDDTEEIQSLDISLKQIPFLSIESKLSVNALYKMLLKNPKLINMTDEKKETFLSYAIKRNNEQEIINKSINKNQNNLEEERNNINDTNNNINNNTTFENVNASNMNCCIGSEQMFKDEEILQELNEVQLKTKERQEKNGENISERSEDDPLYRLNVRDSTPDNIKENVVIPSNKYQNFFDVEEIQEL